MGRGSLFSILLPIIDEVATAPSLLRAREQCKGIKVALFMHSRHLKAATLHTLQNLGTEIIDWKPGAITPKADILILEASDLGSPEAGIWTSLGHKRVAVYPASCPAQSGAIPLLRSTIAEALLGNQSSVPSQTQDAAVTKDLRVLLADDSPLSRKVSMALLRFCGCSADEVDNGKAVLEQLDRKTYDLVVMDGQMPDMDGWDAATLINTPGTLKGPTPQVVALSADLTPAAEDRWHKAGVHIILPKPLGLQMLQTVINRVPKLHDSSSKNPQTAPFTQNSPESNSLGE